MAAGAALSFCECDECAEEDGPMMLFVKACGWPAEGKDGVEDEIGSFRVAKLLDGADMGPSPLPPPGAPILIPNVLFTEAAVGPPTTTPAPPRPLPRGREGAAP